MKFTQDQKARFIGNSIKFTAIFGVGTLIAFLLFNVATAEARGRERALQYEQ